MLVITESEWLGSRIIDQPFTSGFKAWVQMLNFHTIGDILSLEVADLINKPGFSYHALQEWIQFLEERNLAHLLKQG